MARSRKKTSITGMTLSDSEKKDKRMANRDFRRTVKQHIEDEVMPLVREVSHVWSFDKDGKRFFDEDEYPKLMRK